MLEYPLLGRLPPVNRLGATDLDISHLVFAPQRSQNISESAATFIELLYIKQKGMSSANSLSQWYDASYT